MAVTAWSANGPGMVPGSPVSTPGVVVNGAATSPVGPSSGRGYPRG